jgi:hypothetical protein
MATRWGGVGAQGEIFGEREEGTGAGDDGIRARKDDVGAGEEGMATRREGGDVSTRDPTLRCGVVVDGKNFSGR